MNEEIIKEVLEVFKDYSHWMYNSKDGAEGFNSMRVDFEGRKVGISINQQGLYEVIIDEIKAIYHVRIEIAPLRGFMDNIQFMYQIINKEEIPEQLLPLFQKFSIFVLSCFQRSCAFQFFSRMEPVTITGIAHDLSLALPK
jgi:hypothetical protein